MPEGTGQRSAIRATQAWAYLIGRARNRQLVRYAELGEVMDVSILVSLGYSLDNIQQYCRQHNLPPLTGIVVNADGVPGNGYQVGGASAHPYRDQEAVFAYPWFKIVPPTVAEFRTAMAWAKAQGEQASSHITAS